MHALIAGLYELAHASSLVESRVPKIDDEKIKEINAKLNQGLKSTGGRWVNLKEIGLEQEFEDGLFGKFAKKHPKYGPKMTARQVMAWLNIAGKLARGEGEAGQPATRRGGRSMAGASETERAMAKKGRDSHGRRREKGPPEHIKKVGPYGDAETGSVKDSRDRKRELADMARKKRLASRKK